MTMPNDPHQGAAVREALEALRRIAEGVQHYGAPDQELLARRIEARVAEIDAALSAQAQPPAAEGWQPIEGGYYVSATGLVKDSKGNLMGQWKNDGGYLLVRLSRPRRVERVHRLVAAAFVPNPARFPVVNHIDCDRANNAAWNLEWCTQTQNVAHAEALGRMQRDYWSGKRSPNAALSEEQVRAIRAEYAAGQTSMSKIAAEFGVSKRCAGRVIHREVYSDVQ